MRVWLRWMITGASSACEAVLMRQHRLRTKIITLRQAAAYDDGETLEVTRSCTNGTPNANSALYGAAWRAARSLGADRLITYTQSEESGASLRAAGYRVVALRPSQGGWNSPRRPRLDTHPIDVARTLWLIGTDLPTNEQRVNGGDRRSASNRA